METWVWTAGRPPCPLQDTGLNFTMVMPLAMVTLPKRCCGSVLSPWLLVNPPGVVWSLQICSRSNVLAARWAFSQPVCGSVLTGLGTTGGVTLAVWSAKDKLQLCWGPALLSFAFLQHHRNSSVFLVFSDKMVDLLHLILFVNALIQCLLIKKRAF